MTFTQEQVERIVLEVIRRLGMLNGSSAAAEDSVELTLRETVITTHTVEGRLAGVHRLLVGHRAIVTPLVHDELKRRKIELVRQTN